MIQCLEFCYVQLPKWKIFSKYYVATNFDEKKYNLKGKKFYILLVFLLITIPLLIAVSISCYLIKYHAQQKHLLPIYNIKLKQIYIINKN